MVLGTPVSEARRLPRDGVFFRRFFVGALLIALVPLVAVSVFYDRFYLNALKRTSANQAQGTLVAIENRIDLFLQERLQELHALADLPGSKDADSELSDTQKSIMQVLADDPAIYGVLQIGRDEVQWWVSDHLVNSINLRGLPSTPFFDAELIGPILPDKNRPGWFVIALNRELSSPLDADRKNTFGLVVRLNSLTEQLNDALVPIFQQPVLVTPQRDALTRLGTIIDEDAQETVLHATQDIFLPGWSLQLRLDENNKAIELAGGRLWLLLVAIGAGIAVLVMTRTLSRQMRSQIEPIIAAAERVASGDFDTPLEFDATGEIHTLALAQERMRLRLKRLLASSIAAERRAVLGQFAAGVAHEIRNPLATIKATVQALSRKESNSQRRELMAAVGEEIDRASDVLQLLLDYASPPASHPDQVSCRDVIETVKILMDATAAANGVMIDASNITENYILADPAQVRQILVNLVLNAVEAMHGIGGTISLQCRRRGGFVYIFVKDEGPGVNAEQFPFLTEPFFTTKPQGSGLGLAICSQLAIANGGTLSFRNHPGAGLTVIVKLPLYITPEEDAS